MAKRKRRVFIDDSEPPYVDRSTGYIDHKGRSIPFTDSFSRRDYNKRDNDAVALGYDSYNDMVRQAKSDNFGKVVGISLTAFIIAALSLRNYQKGLGLNPIAGFFP